MKTYIPPNADVPEVSQDLLELATKAVDTVLETAMAVGRLAGTVDIAVETNPLTLAFAGDDLADLTKYLCMVRQTQDASDMNSKLFGKLRRKLEQVIAIKADQIGLDSFKNEWGTFTITHKAIPKLPKFGTLEHDTLLEHLETTRSDLIRREVNFKQMESYFNALNEQGEGLPPGCDQYIQSGIRLTPKKNA